MGRLKQQLLPKPNELQWNWSNPLVFFTEACLVILTGDAAVGGHHHRMGTWVLDNVLPVDRVCVTQELVLVHVHASAQDLCGQKRGNTDDVKVAPLGLFLFSFLRMVSHWTAHSASCLHHLHMIVLVWAPLFLFHMRSILFGWSEDKHLMMIGVKRTAGTEPCHIAVIPTSDLFPVCCCCRPPPPLPVPSAGNINYALFPSQQ